MSDAEASGCRDDAWWAGVLWARPPALLVLCGQPVPGLAALALQGGPPGLLFCCHCAQQPSGSAAAPASAAAHPVPASHLWSRAHFGLCVPRLTGSEPLTILPLTLEPEAVAQVHYKACDRLSNKKKSTRASSSMSPCRSLRRYRGKFYQVKQLWAIFLTEVRMDAHRQHIQ